MNGSLRDRVESVSLAAALEFVTAGWYIYPWEVTGM